MLCSVKVVSLVLDRWHALGVRWHPQVLALPGNATAIFKRNRSLVADYLPLMTQRV